ncbi:hypothetical protein D6853_14370 [Butyrivibrio sp. X503]|nr:hypothetical protein D6853_14370 [Butyrivibrio sp. X503]
MEKFLDTFMNKMITFSIAHTIETATTVLQVSLFTVVAVSIVVRCRKARTLKKSSAPTAHYNNKEPHHTKRAW